MPVMPIREQLRTEFDAAVQDLINMRGEATSSRDCVSPLQRPTTNLTSAFYAAIGNSVFEVGLSALEDSTYEAAGPEIPITEGARTTIRKAEA